ncbi:energy transducer TonB [Methylacidiphilum kamchatkense]|nr:energy transducer TonB [Methylacidiphilum kamchatkense]QDQ42336.1 TonB family protein [Methylacidiphilum kamchatkense Kam1]
MIAKAFGYFSKEKLAYLLCMFLAASVHGLLALISLPNKNSSEIEKSNYFSQTDSSSFIDLVSSSEHSSSSLPIAEAPKPPLPPIPSPLPANPEGPKHLLNSPRAIPQSQTKRCAFHTPNKPNKEYIQYSLSTSFLSPPPYPYEARLRHMEGTVVILLDVRKGKIVNSQIVRSSGYPLLDKTAKDWIDSHWKFPLHVNRVIKEAVTFELDDSPPLSNEKYYQTSYIPR